MYFLETISYQIDMLNVLDKDYFYLLTLLRNEILLFIEACKALNVIIKSGSLVKSCKAMFSNFNEILWAG